MRAPVPGKSVASLPESHQTDDKAAGLRDLQRHMQQARQLAPANDGIINTGIHSLDAVFAGAVRPGKIIEWGIPPGKNGRVIPLLFLRNHSLPAIWIYADTGLQVYAPAWASYGIDLERLFFIRSSEPVRQLRPLFLDRLFSLLVLDGPEQLSRGDLAFIGQQARHNGQIIFLIRNYFLSRNRGTAQAGVRVNCWQNSQGGYSINLIKGQHTQKINLDASVVLPHGL